MKTREEQIAEMTKEMRNYGYKHLCAGRVFYYGFCEHLYNAGYRKQSDTVREFVEKLENANCEGNGILIVSEKTLNELAKEYGAEVEE